MKQPRFFGHFEQVYSTLRLNRMNETCRVKIKKMNHPIILFQRGWMIQLFYVVVAFDSSLF